MCEEFLTLGEIQRPQMEIRRIETAGTKKAGDTEKNDMC